MIPAETRVKGALALASDILDNHTENTVEDKAYRNCARLFLQVLEDDDVELEE